MRRPVVPSRERRARAVEHAHQDAREALLLALGRRAEGEGAGDVGGAVGVLGAAVDQVEAARPQVRVRLRRRAVVDDGAVGRVAADGLEAVVLVLGRLGAEGALLRRGRELGDAAGGHRGFEPAQELHHRHAVAHVGGGDAVDLDRVLDRAHRGDRRGREVLRAIGQQVLHAAVGGGGVEPDPGLARGERGEVGGELVVTADLHHLAERLRERPW